MAKRPGAGGFLFVAVILGGITAYLVWGYVTNIQKNSEKNWKPVVVATVDIPPRKKITRDMVEVKRSPEDLIAADAADRYELVVGRMSIARIQAKSQLRTSLVAQDGQSPGLTFDIPPGKRAIAIK